MTGPPLGKVYVVVHTTHTRMPNTKERLLAVPYISCDAFDVSTYCVARGECDQMRVFCLEKSIHLHFFGEARKYAAFLT